MTRHPHPGDSALEGDLWRPSEPLVGQNAPRCRDGDPAFSPCGLTCPGPLPHPSPRPILSLTLLPRPLPTIVRSGLFPGPPPRPRPCSLWAQTRRPLVTVCGG